MCRILIALVLMVAPSVAEAATRYNSGPGLCVGGTGSGCWNDATATWSATSCTDTTYVAAPTSSDDVRLCPGKTVTVPCGTNAALKTLTDDASWTASDTGGLIADGSACSAGQVPTFTFTNTSTTANVLLDGMGSVATFQLVGRSVTTDAPWGEPSDLTDTCGGADKTAHGVTWESAKNECSKYTWANKPYSNSVPAGLSGLTLGNLVWFTSGMYRNNWATVTAATSTTLTIGYGDPDDAFGTQSSMPAITGSSSTSLEVPMDATLTAWDVTNPTRIVASIQSGALSALPSAASGTGQRAGWCLVTDTADGGSGKFYRIAASVDGAGSNDSLVLDPWETVAAADSEAAFLAAGSNAWIAPCVKPGDRWYSFEPVRWQPATAGTDGLATLFVGGLCPVLTRVHMPNVTPLGDGPLGTEAWRDMTSPTVGFYGQRGCTISGPWAIGPLREIGVNGYVMEIKDVASMTVSNTSMQGSYWYTSPATTVFHGFSFFDSNGLVFDAVNASFINNEAFYLHQGTEETSESDSPFEGMNLTIKNSTVHDVFHKYGLSDSGSGIDITGSSHTTGDYTFRVTNNLLYNVVRAGIVGVSGAMPYTATVDSNVIGPIHRQSELDDKTSRGIQFGSTVTVIDPDVYVGNNAILTGLDYNRTTATLTYGLMDANSYYNYIGEWATAIYLSVGATQGFAAYGNLIDSAGAVDATSILTGSTVQTAIGLNRNAATAGSVIVRDTLFRRLCASQGAAFMGIGMQSSAAPVSELDVHITHNTFGMWCPELTIASVAGSGGVIAQARYFFEWLSATSELKNNIFVTGDNVTSATWKPHPILLSDQLSSGSDGLIDSRSFIIGKNFCSACDNGASTCGSVASARECCRNCSNYASTSCAGSGNPKTCCTGAGTGTCFDPYTLEQTGQNMERFSPARRMESLGIAGVTDLRLLPNSPAYGFARGSDHAGARYAGIVSYSQSMRDAGLPEEWLYYRADGDDEPDRTILPQQLKSLVPAGGGGGWLPKAY